MTAALACRLSVQWMNRFCLLSTVHKIKILQRHLMGFLSKKQKQKNDSCIYYILVSSNSSQSHEFLVFCLSASLFAVLNMKERLRNSLHDNLEIVNA